ncbi:aspartyl/asparaginyl beta-hydroxylase domain-containing protein [Xylella fastidiosa]|uniref:Aspartyl/asparaginy/proline hydroxylase domain-containing protein n=1 Tax=Xylella fastidiosa (strain 9a5c) TaxID=160492 RepID=Q9PBU6_XYLFA|nr:aspartyl/asparaginyl beta-hydroxylase domain-containing protein [Xylella fastidiosa]AAF84841.1 hypothetical protein XF_2039 [Xylella fastidiosa 9a5c]KXB09935.1 hypothetical protein ADT29_00555 [Xylella fastidiosa]KXB18464.1 hypothetical protein ADT28_00580 [Xylella fastidiosa]MDG5824098.1 aspartyl/asparaginyl beta-hydroxylase domain-containing protein [Xylella fastidiosa subsp. pauca]MDG5824625.1 aspartyl/asparaginyl beta-hydroxylase domain-containing protein [Xylella fastidiosa subsp. pauc
MQTEKLNKHFDASLLAHDYHQLCKQLGSRPAGYPSENHVGWSAICLFSSTAKDVDLLDEAPTIRTVLADLGLSLRLVRLMCLQPGGEIRRHQDTFLSQRIARLHIPVITDERVHFYIDESRCDWKAGELWYGDFSRPHWGVNESDVERVHLVLDVMVDDALGKLFPEERLPSALESRRAAPEYPINPAKLRRFQFDFDLPQGFHLPGVLDQPLPVPLPGCVRLVDSELCVFINQQPLLKAVPDAEDLLSLVGLGLPSQLQYEFREERVSHVRLVIGGLEKTIYRC